jgi:NAD(P)-dependent dehydrogenase (short-subunit alcohol dehydrogenase family)
LDRHIVEATVKAFGRIDILVNNASMQARLHLHPCGDARW